MKTKSVLHNLSPADQTFVIDLCSKHTYSRVVELLREPRPTGLALKTSITALSRFYAFFHPALCSFDVNHQDATHVNQRDHSEILTASLFLIQQRIFRGLYNNSPLDQLLPTMRFMLRFRSALIQKPEELVSGRARRQIGSLTSRLAERDAQLKRIRAKQNSQKSSGNQFQKRTKPTPNPTLPLDPHSHTSPQPVAQPDTQPVPHSDPHLTSQPVPPTPATPGNHDSNPLPTPPTVVPMPDEPAAPAAASLPPSPAPSTPSFTSSFPIPSGPDLAALAEALGFSGDLPDVNPFDMDLKKAKPIELLAGLMKLDSIQQDFQSGDEPFNKDQIDDSVRCENAQPDPKILPSQFDFPTFSAKNPGNSALSTNFHSMNTHQESTPPL